MNKTKWIIGILIVLSAALVIAAFYYTAAVKRYKASHYGVEPVWPLYPVTPDEASSIGFETAFGRPHPMTVGQETTFADGLTIRLKEINDSRCQPNMQCIWEGEITAVFEVSVDDQRTWQEIRLGTVRTKSATLDGYVVTLGEAQPDSASVIVEEK